MVWMESLSSIVVWPENKRESNFDMSYGCSFLVYFWSRILCCRVLTKLARPSEWVSEREERIHVLRTRLEWTCPAHEQEPIPVENQPQTRLESSLILARFHDCRMTAVYVCMQCMGLLALLSFSLVLCSFSCGLSIFFRSSSFAGPLVIIWMRKKLVRMDQNSSDSNKGLLWREIKFHTECSFKGSCYLSFTCSFLLLVLYHWKSWEEITGSWFCSMFLFQY